MAEDWDDRTEEPTEHRRDEARSQGNIAKSTDLTAAALMLAAAASLLMLIPDLSLTLAEFTASRLSNVAVRIDQGWAMQVSREALRIIALTAGPTLLLSASVIIGANLAQVGFLFAPAALQPKLSRLNPLSGLQRIFSVQSLMKLAVSVGKLMLLSLVTAALLYLAMPEFLTLIGSTVGTMVQSIHTHSVRLAFVLAVVLIGLGVSDYFFQLWKHNQELRMTKQELRDEMKNMDGDPQIRQRRREAHRKLASSRELGAVKGADVVVTNPTHYAVALRYDPATMNAPAVVAKGVDEKALQIRRIAAEHGVPILERPVLARQLYRDVRVGWPIPADLYATFAEILHYVYRVTGRKLPELQSVRPKTEGRPPGR